MNFTSTDLSFENKLPKLIRDNIPDIIQQREGKIPDTKIAQNDDEFMDFLLKKIVEEATELKHSSKYNNTQEEIADLLEIVDAILVLNGWKKEDIVKIQDEKREKNGGFEKRIILLSK